VYVCAAHTDATGRDFFREKEGVPYRKFGGVELFLSNLIWKKTDGYMDEEKGVVVNNRLTSRACTLAPSTSLCLAYPLLPEDNIDETVLPGTIGMFFEAEKTKFSLVDLWIGNLNKIPVRNCETLPSELHRFVRTMPSDSDRDKKIVGIMFASSCRIDVPNHVKKDWSLGPQINLSVHKGDPAWLIHAPGQYADFPRMSLDRYVRQGITIRKPGDCVMCRGSSGDKVHIGFTDWSDGPYLDGLLCRPCFKNASSSWMRLLDQVE
jgi:hypothetical protein